MIILHAAPVSWRAIGGLHASIPALVSSQNCLAGVDAALLVTASGLGEPREVPFPVFRHKLRLDDDGRLNLPAPFARPDLVVFHSTYIPAHAAIAAKLRKAAIPYVICPRGGMTHFAQRYRRWKKVVANALFFNKMVAHAKAVNCLTQGEADASTGWTRPVFVVGNGIHVPARPDPTAPRETARLRLVFIGRLHIAFKGLDMLLESCRLVRAEMLRAGAVVELYGPDCDGSTKTLARLITRLHLEDVVTLHGPVLGKAKASLLEQADVFVHPSRSEGHPMAVLEALAYGVPCLLTPVTNMADEVVHAGAGWKTEPSPAAIAATLKKVIQTDRSLLRRAGSQARRLAHQEYRWGKIAVRSIREYRKYAA